MLPSRVHPGGAGKPPRSIRVFRVLTVVSRFRQRFCFARVRPCVFCRARVVVVHGQSFAVERKTLRHGLAHSWTMFVKLTPDEEDNRCGQTAHS